MKRNKLIFNFFANRNRKQRYSRKRSKILADNRKGQHPLRPSFNVYADVDNRERATARDKKGELFLEKQHKNFLFFILFYFIFIFL